MSDINRPAITTSLGPLRPHFNATQKPEASQEGKSDRLTRYTKHEIENIYQRANDLTQHGKEHYTKHRERWINRQYGELLKKAGPLPDLAPSWAMRDRSVHMHRAATVMVDHRQNKRMRKIQRAMINEVKKVATHYISNARTKDKGVGR